MAFYLLVFLLFLGLFAPYIANHQPLYVRYKGQTYYPAWQTGWVAQNLFGATNTDTIFYQGKKEIIQFDLVDWRKVETQYIVWPLVPFSPGKPDYYNRDYVAPGDEQLVPLPNGTTAPATGKFRHLLGTDNLGRDVLSGLIHGIRQSLFIGVISMLIASILGIFIGGLSGYFGDTQFKISRLALWLLGPACIIAYFIGFIARSTLITEGFETSTFQGIQQFSISFILLLGIPMLVATLANYFKWGFLGQKVNLPIDALFSRFTEIFISLPKLLLIISLTAIFEQRSVWLLVLVIGCTSWTDIARLTRAELLRIRELDYITAARSMGLKNRHIIFNHALPNAMSGIFVSITFGVASAILIESSLTFLGIGLPDDAVTWGSMLSLGKQELEAWWMLLFPGLAIFITLLVFNILGEGLRDAADPKHTRRT